MPAAPPYRTRLLLLPVLLLLLLGGSAPADAATAQAKAMRAAFLTRVAAPLPATLCSVDSGADVLPALTSAVVARAAIDGGTPGDVLGHGTTVAAAMVAAPQRYAPAGIFPAGRLITVRVIAADGSADNDDVAAGIDRCVGLGAKVVEVAMTSASTSPALTAATGRAAAADVLVVAADGNDHGAPAGYPAALPDVLGVGGADRIGERCEVSSATAASGLVAPGCNLDLIAASGEPVTGQGTSFASAFVAAAAAAIRANTTLSAAQVHRLLVDTARPVAAGRAVDVRAAFRAAGLQPVIAAARLRRAARQRAGARTVRRMRRTAFSHPKRARATTGARRSAVRG